VEHTEILELRGNNNLVPMFFIYFEQVWEEAEKPCASINFAQHITFFGMHE